MTLTELAALCGTSVATVSKAFSGSHEISNATRDRIFETAKNVGCFDKYYKGTRERPLIGLIFPEPESEHYGIEIGLFERELSRWGADTVIAITRFDKEREARLFRELAYRMRVDGVILSGGGDLIENPDEIPLVAFSSGNKKAKNADNVIISLQKGIFDLISLVKAYGHRDVGFIGESLTISKLELFRAAMRHVGLPVRERFIAVSKKRFADAGEDCMRSLTARGKLPSVIVAAYDQIAFGAMKYAREHGLRIPEDISFVGIDDISVTNYIDVPLTSLHIHTEKVCEQVVDLIFKRMDNRHWRERTEITVPVTLNLRKSLGKVN